MNRQIDPIHLVDYISRSSITKEIRYKDTQFQLQPSSIPKSFSPPPKTQVRLNQNVEAFYLKRTCVLDETYLCFSPNALAFSRLTNIAL